MHLLHTADDDQPPVPVAEAEELVRRAVNELAAMVLTDQRQAFARMQQEIESYLSVINEEAIARMILPHLEAMLREQVSAFLDEAQSRPFAPLRPLEARAGATGAGPLEQGHWITARTRSQSHWLSRERQSWGQDRRADPGLMARLKRACEQRMTG
jgi:hypothetical protein